MEYQPTPRNRLPPYRTHSAASPSSGPISSTGSRYRSQLLRESTFDSKETTHIASDFLRSALERERACRRTTLENNDKLVRSSPVRAATADPSRRSRHHRGASLEGNEHHCPLGAKEASETISKLHNENFNLKLEVYHRREREVVLEERVQKLEAEIVDRSEVEKKLREEIAAKETEIKTQSAAVQEAVNLIMNLELKVEKYERGEIVQDDESAVDETPTPAARDASRLEDEITALARMPSFVSDLSANTENLRNVYLNQQGSTINLIRGDVSDARGPSYTPNLSILDEIYGDVKQPKFEPSVRGHTPVQPRKTKEEKRIAIEKALAEAQLSRPARLDKPEQMRSVHNGVPLAREILPPTPDTMKSSTLERGQSSKETLSQQPSIPEDPGTEPSVIKMSIANPPAAASVTAFHDRKALQAIPRPRSASEATTTPLWDASDTDSMESDVDIWLRERGQASPDLFGFPSIGPRWDSDQMFGVGSAITALSHAPATNPPNRRSSLQAPTSTPGWPRTRGTPSVVRSERYDEYSDDRNGATPPPIQLQRTHMEVSPQPDDGGVSLKAREHIKVPSTLSVPQSMTKGQNAPVTTQVSTTQPTPQTPTVPITPNGIHTKRRWFGLGRAVSVRKC